MGAEGSSKEKLYIRLPVKIKDEFQIKELHPNIIQVNLPRQKSRRWCIIEFENKEKLQEAIAVLRKVKINNKPVKISPCKKGDNKKNKPKKKPVQSTKPLVKLLKKST